MMYEVHFRPPRPRQNKSIPKTDDSHAVNYETSRRVDENVFNDFPMGCLHDETTGEGKCRKCRIRRQEIDVIFMKTNCNDTTKYKS